MIRVCCDVFTAELSADGKPNTAPWKLKQLGGVDGRVERCQFRGWTSLGCPITKSTSAALEGMGTAIIAKWIVGMLLLRELRPVQRSGRPDSKLDYNARMETDLCHESILDLTVAEPAIVTPVPVEQFVTLDTGSGEEYCIGLVIKYSVAEFEAARERLPPEIICSNGLNGLKALAGTPVSSWVGVSGGSSTWRVGVCGGIAIRDIPGGLEIVQCWQRAQLRYGSLHV